ncbi:MAG: MotA/TolQ/ExbB proton channel family protein [Planctomycetes bacterium]|nr:MotA/TolQ/ExbB proton channel family protein [Planctomycetota bacterium]
MFRTRTFASRASLWGLTALMMFCFSAAVVTTFMAPSVAMAQDEDVAAEPAPADEGAAPARRQSYLGWMFKALGIRYTVVFLALSFTMVALFVMNLLTARRDNICPAHLEETYAAHLDNKQYQEAFELAKNDESFLGNVLAAGMSKLSQGYEHAIEAMQEVGEEENMKLEHRLSYMALIGTLAPMVGLFGTVDGMIASFSVIAAGGATPKASELAEGISTALFTTLVGLAIAIPAIAAYNILKNRVSRLVLEVGIVSEDLLSRFQTFTGQGK